MNPKFEQEQTEVTEVLARGHRVSALCAELCFLRYLLLKLP